MTHINDFIALFNIPGGGKKWWLEQPVENEDGHFWERIQEYNKIA